MKSKYNLNVFLLFLFLIVTIPLSKSAVKIDVKENRVTAKTDKKGVEGFTGCKKKYFKKATAYIYDLYLRDEKINSLNEQCGSYIKNPFKRYLRVQTSSNTPIEFKELIPGTYKIVTYYAVAKGCNIEDEINSDELGNYPSNAIVYEKEESESFIIREGDYSENEKETPKLIQSKFDVYPVPTTGKIFINIQGLEFTENSNLSIYSLVGGDVENILIPNEQKDLSFEIDLSHYKAGTYLISVTDRDGQRYQKKIVILSND